MTDTDYTVSTDVAISAATISATTDSCPYVTVKLTGNAAWDDALELLSALSGFSCTVCEDLDGYEISVTQSLYKTMFTFTSPTSIDHIGGCMATATTASAICSTGGVYYSTSWKFGNP